jgi:hypothetical protein
MPLYNQVGIQNLQRIYASEPEEMVVGNLWKLNALLK